MSLTITTTLSLSSQSVANNTSTVNWKVKYSKSSTTYNNNGVKYYVNVDGNRVKSGTWKPKKGTTSGTIASGTTTIKHNADGSHAQIRAYAKVYDTGFSPSSADDYSPYLSLPTIKRTYTVSYNANGGSGAPAAQTKTYGVNLTLSSTKPTRAGYTFKGWATSSTGAVAYPAGGTYTANSAITLYAVWEVAGNIKIGSYSAIRCDENGVAADEGTWGKFTCTYILSGQALNEGSITTARYRASDVSTWTDITNITQSEHSKPEGVASLQVNVSCLISDDLLIDKSYVIELIVKDSYGNTAIASDYISQAYFTMDFLAGGKGIGIGTVASCDESEHPKGLLTCGMDAVFTQMAGEVKMWAGNTIPKGWLPCDGSEVSKATYPKLYQAIGDLWGTPTDSSNFKLPNLNGRVPVGYNSSDTDFATVGKMSGEKTHKLTTTEMPSHGHSGNGWTFSVYKGTRSSESVGGIGGSGFLMTQVKEGGSWSGYATTPAAGGNGSHNNLQPYAVIKYIICAI